MRAVAHKSGSALAHKGNTAAIRITCLPCDKNMVDIPEKLLVADGFSHNGIEAGAQRALDGVKGVPIGVVVRVLRQPVQKIHTSWCKRRLCKGEALFA